MSRKLRNVAPADLARLREVARTVAGCRSIVRLLGARKSAAKLSRAVASLCGAVRHAERCAAVEDRNPRGGGVDAVR